MFDINELMIIRQSLDVISILGKDAKYVASLQVKIEDFIGEQKIPPPPSKSKAK